jgi:hypothetical protein
MSNKILPPILLSITTTFALLFIAYSINSNLLLNTYIAIGEFIFNLSNGKVNIFYMDYGNFVITISLIIFTTAFIVFLLSFDKASNKK